MTGKRSRAVATPPTFAAIYRHVGDAHQRLATVTEVNDDVAAACVEDLYAALELLEDIEPSLRAKATAN
jgi:hypothetical protein